MKKFSIILKKIVVSLFIPAVLILPSVVAPAEDEAGGATALLVSPEVMDLGVLTPVGEVKGVYFMHSPLAKTLAWSTGVPEGWIAVGGERLAGRLTDSLGSLEVGIRFVEGETPDEMGGHLVQMALKTGGDILVLEKALPLGRHCEKIEVHYAGASRTLVLKFETALSEPGPKLSVEPFGLDFGTIEGSRTTLKKLHVRNVGKGTLSWKTGIGSVSEGQAGKWFYVSFLNENKRDGEAYAVPDDLENVLQLDGKWFTDKGYPACRGEEGTMSFLFSGTGIAVIFHPEKEECSLKAYIDDLAPVEMDRDPEEGRAAVVVAENLSDGHHVLEVMSKRGLVMVEGVRIFGGEVLTGVPGWLKVFPSTGTTTSETDYVTVFVDTENLKTGLYGDAVVIRSNGGDAAVDVSLRVTRHIVTKFIDVYRYVKGNDYLYTGHPEAEGSGVLEGYRKQGFAFRLFREDTPGTKKFYRWYNKAKGDHYYTTDPDGDGKRRQGYVLEGYIGNIGTSKILGTRELYRWQNPSTGCHFYTTDPRGEGMAKKGYRFDGIAGYVR
ncbi:MAG: hypothetical protein KBG01_06455 [Syntrophobacterales bacterium]|nr:hypothetical protein [Syntrophobacterales bacterium]